jgi:hypothetical protein
MGRSAGRGAPSLHAASARARSRATPLAQPSTTPRGEGAEVRKRRKRATAETFSRRYDAPLGVEGLDACGLQRSWAASKTLQEIIVVDVANDAGTPDRNKPEGIVSGGRCKCEWPAIRGHRER